MSVPKSQSTKRRLDYELIEALVPHGTKVLDLGCGDGSLIEQLVERKGCQGYGIEINEELVLKCIGRGVAVYHGDMLEGMQHYPDRAFDLVILSQTLQQASEPLRVVRDMLRVGGKAIISFPNFGFWRVRMQLMLTGRMPRTDQLPYNWYDTPNVHLCTVDDFCALCDQEGLVREHEIFLAPPARPISRFLANWRAGLAIFELRRSDMQPLD